MKSLIINLVLGAAILIVLSLSVYSWVGAAAQRNEAAMAEKAAALKPQLYAGQADEGYCSPALKVILKRVLTSCGLVKGGKPGRGCEPIAAKNVASMSGSDFNALFKPMANRASIIQFDSDSAELDDAAKKLLRDSFSDQKGASYFFVVSRASTSGSSAHNKELSEKRGNAVLDFLKANFNDPDLEQEVGLLWLGDEFAQLDKEYCDWKRSRPDGKCNSETLNRSAFITWVDCRL